MNSHLNLRMSNYDKKIVESAAKIKGLKPQTYSRQTLLEAAKKDIESQSYLTLNERDWDFLLEMLDAPIDTNIALRKAAEDFNKYFG